MVTAAYSATLSHLESSSSKLATLYLPSPPVSPSSPSSISTPLAYPSVIATSARLACPRPSLVARVSRIRRSPYDGPGNYQDLFPLKMSQESYAGWPTGVKSVPDQFSASSQASITATRRSGSAEQQAASFAYGSYPQVRAARVYRGECGVSACSRLRSQQADAQRRMQSRASGPRAHSSSTSSLSGAMGDAQIAAQPRASVTPPSGLASWTPSPTSTTMSSGAFMSVPDDISYLTPVTPIPSASPSGAFASYAPYNVAMYGSPDASPGMSSSGFADQFAYQQRAQSSASMMVSPSVTPAPRHSHSPHDSEEEIQRLHQRIRELELVAESSRRRIRELETEVSRGSYPGGLPSPLPTPAPPPTFNEEWRARTDARVKLLCSLNRAGNALCAWHDPRRERRKFPPRMAPPGYLNCGCTYEEALFEESLSRHGVGNYLPGESVRMDPALRNPLLKLLQERYGYRDGDFERNPVTGNWVESEGASKWEHKVASGTQYPRRNRTESDRR